MPSQIIFNNTCAYCPQDAYPITPTSCNCSWPSIFYNDSANTCKCTNPDHLAYPAGKCTPCPYGLTIAYSTGTCDCGDSKVIYSPDFVIFCYCYPVTVDNITYNTSRNYTGSCVICNGNASYNTNLLGNCTCNNASFDWQADQTCNTLYRCWMTNSYLASTLYPQNYQCYFCYNGSTTNSSFNGCICAHNGEYNYTAEVCFNTRINCTQVGDNCTLCPPGAVQYDYTCGCGGGVVYDNVTNQCICEQGQKFTFFAGNKTAQCICVQPSESIFDQKCIVCQTEIAIFNQQTGTCTCKNQQMDWTLNDNCTIQYDCGQNYFINASGQCQLCTASTVNPSKTGCICEQQNQNYNQQSGRCECASNFVLLLNLTCAQCPNLSVYSNNTCYCQANRNYFNPKTGLCECNTFSIQISPALCIPCPINTIQNPNATSQCICPEGSVFVVYNYNSYCVCNISNYSLVNYNNYSLRCQLCTTLVENQTTFNIFTGQCECANGANFYYNQSCIMQNNYCENSTVLQLLTGRCESCPPGSEYSNSTCTCVQGYVFDQQYFTCVVERQQVKKQTILGQAERESEIVEAIVGYVVGGAIIFAILCVVVAGRKQKK